MSLTYFARPEDGPLVQLDEELALQLYEITVGGDRGEEEPLEEYRARVEEAAKKLFDVGAKAYVGDTGYDTYVFGGEFSEKDIFELKLKHEFQTREEFAESNYSK